MSFKLCSNGLVIDDKSLTFNLPIFMDSVLRGIGQVLLQNNSYSGLLFFIGIFYNSTLFGVAVLVGTVVSTLTAIIFGMDPSKVRSGLFGFNGALVAIALSYFLHSDSLTWVYVIFASSFSTVLMAAAIRLLDVWKMPTLTSPFVLTALGFLLACARLGRLQSTNVLPNAGLPIAATVEGIVTLSTVAEGLFNGIGQVFFQENIVTGVIFSLALLISSRRAFIMGLLGSLTGILIAWILGAAEPAIRSGAFSFNSVLTAVAVGGIFTAINIASIIYMSLAVIVTTVVFAGVSAALEPLGMPAMTLPFVLVVWVFVLASPLFPKLQGKA